MGLVELIAAAWSLVFVVQGILCVPLHGSVPLFLVGTASLGIFLATLVRTMPQFGMRAVLIMLRLQLLSGNATPRESMPEFV